MYRAKALLFPHICFLPSIPHYRFSRQRHSQVIAESLYFPALLPAALHILPANYPYKYDNLHPTAFRCPLWNILLTKAAKDPRWPAGTRSFFSSSFPLLLSFLHSIHYSITFQSSSTLSIHLHFFRIALLLKLSLCHISELLKSLPAYSAFFISKQLCIFQLKNMSFYG